MFPFNFEWVWDMGHIVFHGGLWYALSVLGMGMTFVIIKSIIETMQGNGGGHHH